MSARVAQKTKTSLEIQRVFHDEYFAWICTRESFENKFLTPGAAPIAADAKPTMRARFRVGEYARNCSPRPLVFAVLATVRLHFAVQLHGMAAMLEKTCPVCDKRHTFLLADLIATAAEDREYWFTCPEIVKVGIIKFDRLADVWNAVAESPNGCVRAY